jgi:hypothetical protein
MPNVNISALRSLCARDTCVGFQNEERIFRNFSRLRAMRSMFFVTNSNGDFKYRPLQKSVSLLVK